MAVPPSSRALTAWFEQSQRPLPWRDTYDPYHVWLSEVMLQQTQVETVLPYYERFLARFPTLDALAGANEDEVLTLWSGLGYYSRARNLLKAARQVVTEHEGRVPGDYDRLIALPGVGRYMAGAILSIAFDEPFPIVDGNVRRVLSRLNGWREPPDSAVWEAAAVIVESGNPRTLNQAMMELGATVCTFKRPRCEACPLDRDCVAYKTGTQAEIPSPKKRPRKVHIDLYAILDRNRHGFLMKEEKGLWEFPTLPEPPGDGFEHLGTCRHTITHHRLEVRVYAGKLSGRNGCRRVRFEDVPVTSLTRKIHALGESTASPPKSRPRPAVEIRFT